MEAGGEGEEGGKVPQWNPHPWGHQDPHSWGQWGQQLRVVTSVSSTGPIIVGQTYYPLESEANSQGLESQI